MRKPPLPREHGAWVMFFVPLLLGNILAPTWQPGALLLGLAALGFFLARHPLGLLFKIRTHQKKEAQRVYLRNWLFVYLSIGGLAGGWLLFVDRLILLAAFVLPMVVFLALDVYWVLQRKSMTILAESVGIVGLSLGAPVSAYVASGVLEVRMFVVGGLCALYFMGSIFYVKLKVRKQPRLDCPQDWRQRVSVAKENFVYHLVVFAFLGGLLFWAWLPHWALLAFVPVTIKALWGSLSWQDKQTLNLMKIGLLECFHALTFCLLLSIAFF